jgi:hypothetical protein
MMCSQRLGSLVTLVVGGVFLVPRAAPAARAPDIVKKSFEFRGQAAQTFSRLLQLAADRDATLRFELSQAAEHRALPERDAELRDERGTLSSNLGWRTSDHAQVTATWRPAARLLRIEGYVADTSTGYPRSEGPACWFSSPLFSESEIDRLPGWKALFLALRPLPPKRGQGAVAEQRVLEATLDAGRRVVLSLVRIETWDDQSRPVQPFQVSIGFGPPAGKCE